MVPDSQSTWYQRAVVLCRIGMSLEERRATVVSMRAGPRVGHAPVGVLRRPGAHHRYWKATLRSAPVLGFILLGKWHEEVRIFRWKWLAKAAALRHRFRTARDTLTEAIVEPYRPGDNVIPIGASRFDG
jgi:hypothetical protein